MSSTGTPSAPNAEQGTAGAGTPAGVCGWMLYPEGDTRSSRNRGGAGRHPGVGQRPGPWRGDMATCRDTQRAGMGLGKRDGALDTNTDIPAGHCAVGPVPAPHKPVSLPQGSQRQQRGASCSTILLLLTIITQRSAPAAARPCEGRGVPGAGRAPGWGEAVRSRDRDRSRDRNRECLFRGREALPAPPALPPLPRGQAREQPGEMTEIGGLMSTALRLPSQTALGESGNRAALSPAVNTLPGSLFPSPCRDRSFLLPAQPPVPAVPFLLKAFQTLLELHSSHTECSQIFGERKKNQHKLPTQAIETISTSTAKLSGENIYRVFNWRQDLLVLWTWCYKNTRKANCSVPL